ncbi:MAG TPA: MFS transporter [Burkholderiales bacterium]
MSLAYGTQQPCDRAQLSAHARPYPSTAGTRRWVLAASILGSSLAFIESSVVNLALPSIQSGLGTTSTGVQWVVNAYLLVLVAFMLIGGALGDRYGLRRVFTLGTALFGAAALGCALAPSAPLLIAARLAQGLGGALLVPASLAMISAHFDARERGRAIGTWAGASALTTAIGPVLGGWLVDHWGWPAVFLIMPPLAALTLAIAARIPASPVATERRLDYFGGVLTAVALGLLVYGLVNPATPPQRTALLLLALLVGGAFLWHESRFGAPMLPLSLFRSRIFAGANLMTLLLYFALTGVLYFLPFNLIQVQGYTAARAGAALLPFAVIMGLGSTFAGDSIRRHDPRVVLTIGPMITAAGFVALAVPGAGVSLASFLPGIVVVGIGMTVGVAPLTTVVMSSGAEPGIASAVNNTAARLGGVLAIAALTAFAVLEFAGALADRLAAAGVPAGLAEQLLADASRLAGLAPPSGTPPALAAAVGDAVARSYVQTFRVVAGLCAVLAAVSGLIAWFTLADSGLTVRERASTGR